ncbi:hypothetical protein [Amycolatopsis sp. CA-126428]|nr:hypothetical protein [Amycolatopsis sp. CA-126428]
MAPYDPMSFHHTTKRLILRPRVLGKLGFEAHHLSTEDSGVVVWLTRSLP